MSEAEFSEYLWQLSRLQFAILRRDSGKTIGVVQGIDEDQRSGTIGIGLLTDPQLWRAGWPLEAVVLFINYLFCGIGYRKVYFKMPSSVIRDLWGSRDVWLKQEGRLERHIRVHDENEYEDLHIMALYREQWDSSFARQITGNAARGD